MSGGSFDYLCYKGELEEILTHRYELNKMIERLTELGYKDAAKEAEKMLLTLDQFETRFEAMWERLQNIFWAVEWMDSGDTGIEEVNKQIKKYRNGD